MDPSPSSKMRGTILRVPDSNPGLLFLNGDQKPFTLEGVWKSAVAPAPNMAVDVDLDSSGSIVAITVVDSHQIAKERMNELGGVAQEKGKEAAKWAQSAIGAQAARMGAVALASAALVCVGWFLFPAASIPTEIPASLSFTMWNLSGIDGNDAQTIAGGGTSHGAIAFLCLAALAVPFAVPFIRVPWARYLYAAPLAFVLIAAVTSYMQMMKTIGPLVSMGMPNPFSWNWGVFVVGIAAAVLAANALKPRPGA